MPDNIGEIKWKQVAGYPPASFCVTHDRFVEPILISDAQGTVKLGCPYCAEEIWPQAGYARKEEPKISNTGHLAAGRHYTFWCPVNACLFSTNNGSALDTHKKFAHGDVTPATEDIICQEGKCSSVAHEFCVQCEIAMCKDHLDWHNMCPPCASLWWNKGMA
jgi:hypothetical protein